MITQPLIRNLVISFLKGMKDRSGRMPRFFFNGYGHFVIVTGESQDPGRSSNGGEYYWYRKYSSRDGKAWAECSCDFWQPEPQTLRFRPMSRRRFVQHVRIARRLAERLHRRGVRLNAWGQLRLTLTA